MVDLNLNLSTFLLQAFLWIGIGLPLGSLINALWLRLAATWIGIDRIEYRAAYRTCLLTGFVTAGFVAPIFFMAWIIAFTRDSTVISSSQQLLWTFSPGTLIYFVVASVLAHGLIYSQVVKDAGGNRLRFGRAITLAVVYGGIASMFGFVLLLLTGAITEAVALRR